MTKIRAVLDQETWVEVDVPDEFQAIITSLSLSEALISENPDDAQGNLKTSYSEVVTSNVSSFVIRKSSVSQSQTKQANSNEISTDITVKEKSTPVAETVGKNKADVVNSVAQNNHSSIKERGKSTSQTLLYKDVGFHMVNWSVTFFFFFFAQFLSLFLQLCLIFSFPHIICSWC